VCLVRFEVASDNVQMHGVIIDVDEKRAYRVRYPAFKKNCRPRMFLPTHINRYLCPAVAALVSCFVINNAALFAQEGDIEYVLDATSTAIPLPDIFKPSMDLSGRGFTATRHGHSHLPIRACLISGIRISAWPGSTGFNTTSGKSASFQATEPFQEKLIANYEALIKRVNDSGGVVMLNIFSTPQGQGKVLDKKVHP